MMEKRFQLVTRDRAILAVRLATLGGLVSALGLTWVFSNLAETFFSGKPAAADSSRVPLIAAAPAPVQAPPAVIQKIVHHPYQGGTTSGGSAPRPPVIGPGKPPPTPPPPPPCHSTPSKPC
jgi:hypothetical protein